MSEPRPRRRIAAGETVEVDGVAYIIDRIDSQWASLLAPDGSTRRMPLRELALVVMGEEAPPPITQDLDALEARMSDEAKAKFEERRAILRWYDLGLRPEQSDYEEPDPCHDPELVPLRIGRIMAMARVMAERRDVKVASAQTTIRRVLAAGAAGDAGLVDPRLLKPDALRRNQDLETAVHEFLDSRTFMSRVTRQSKYTLFKGWLWVEREQEAPSKRQFERALTSLYARYPSLEQKTKTLASAEQRPKVATQRRRADRLGEFWLIDSTASNVMLRDPYSTTEKARTYRLASTTILEGASKYIVGHAFGEDVNALTTSLALASAFLGMVDEHDAIVHEGRTYPRPFSGLPRVISRFPVVPRRLIGDNGPEIINRQSLWNLHRLGIDCEALRVKDPRGKAPKERFYGSLDKGFDQLQPNYLGHAIDQRGRDATKNVILTFDAHTERFRAFIDSYNVTQHDGLKAQLGGRMISPAARWIELAEEHGITEVPSWQNEWIRYLPNQVVVLNRHGVSRRRMIYNAPVLAAMIDIDGAAPTGTVRIFWHPNDLRQLYCFDRDGNAWELPWVCRNDETPAFSDFTLDWANGRLEGATRSKKEHQQLLQDLVRQWSTEDVVLIAQLNGKRNAEEILASQLDELQRRDLGSLIGADRFVGQEVIDSIQAANEQLPPDDNVDPFTDDLFGEFD